MAGNGSGAAAIARLDQALAAHPLTQAFLSRFRLEAVRQQAAVDGALIDPWQLAAALEGLRLRMDPYLRIIERGVIIDSARTALTCTNGSSRPISIRKLTFSAPKRFWPGNRNPCRR